MKTELKINLSTILVLVAGVVFFFWLNGKKNRDIQRHLNVLSEKEFAFEEYKAEVDSAVVTWQAALGASNEALRAAVAHDSIQEELISHYKNLSTVIRYETVFVHDTVNVSVPIYIKNDTTVNLSDPCMSASLSLYNGGLSLNGPIIHNRQDIIVGDQKSGLRRTESIVSIRNTNPCLTSATLQTYNVVYEKKWWENPLITIPASVAVGFVAGSIVN
jgi:hypothetical protein